MKQLVFSLLSIASASCLRAEVSSDAVSLDDFLLTRSAATAPSYILKYRAASEVDFDSAAGGFSAVGFSLRVPLTKPIQVNERHALLIGTSYDQTSLDTDTFINDVNLHDFRLHFRWLYGQPGSDWSWMTVLSPGLVTDGESVDSDDFSLNGRVGVRYQVSDRFAWLGGVVFFMSDYETRVYPGVGFQWRPTDSTQVDFTGISLKSSWQPSDDWIVSFNVQPAGGVWNIESGGADLNVDLDRFQAGLGIERRLSERMWLGLSAGMTFANDLEVESSSGVTVFEDDADTGYFAELGIRMTVW